MSSLHFRMLETPFRPRALGSGLFATLLSNWVLVSAAGVGLLGAYVLVVGPSHIMAPWDVFILMDGGWHIFSGQVAHTDFHNPIGVLTYALIALGMELSGPSLEAQVLGSLVLMAMLAPWAIAVGYRRLSPAAALLLTIFVAVLVVANRPLGYDPAVTSYAMIYNRYGWAMLALLMVQLFVRVDDKDQLSKVFDPCSAGALLGLIFFCKINFFVVGCGALVLAMIMRRDLRRWFPLTALAFLAICLGARYGLGVHLGDYLSDISDAAKSQSLAMRLAFAMSTLKHTLLPLGLLAAAWAVLVGLPTLREGRHWSRSIEDTVILGFVVASALFVTIGNTGEKGDIPLLFIAGLILVERQRLSAGPAQSVLAGWDRGLIAMLLILPLFVGIFWKDVASLASSAAWRDYTEHAVPESQRFASEPLRDFVIPHSSDWPTAYWLAKEIPSRLNEGVALLRRHTGRDSKVVTLGADKSVLICSRTSAAKGSTSLVGSGSFALAEPLPRSSSRVRRRRFRHLSAGATRGQGVLQGNAAGHLAGICAIS